MREGELYKWYERPTVFKPLLGVTVGIYAGLVLLAFIRIITANLAY